MKRRLTFAEQEAETLAHKRAEKWELQAWRIADACGALALVAFTLYQKGNELSPDQFINLERALVMAIVGVLVALIENLSETTDLLGRPFEEL